MVDAFDVAQALRGGIPDRARAWAFVRDFAAAWAEPLADGAGTPTEELARAEEMLAGVCLYGRESLCIERNGGVGMADPYVILNELAQGLRPMPQGIEWFEGLSTEDRSNTLRLLSQFCIQARATAEDAPESIRRAGLRATHTPAVLITRGRIDQQLGKIAALTPHDERLKSFRLLIAVLAVADERRRERFCSDGCGHAWHHLSVDISEASA
ncbi:DUF5958 family protein [Streptomyces huasconensis]|uniref:DUF5958 family protein n=1 Tax=Streptomyces huasconensis TaxID=1854574 RepID=UPI0033D15C95